MIDPVTSLAFSMHSNKGVFALLLGSGFSRSAQVPTGWEILLDLIRRVAAVEGSNCDPDPVAWYREKHKDEPAYSGLLDELAKTPPERNSLLRSYFEPTEDERRSGRKMPTAAHRAVAQLAADGYVRVILTTNFDRLLEAAFEERGLSPLVVSTADAIEGMRPLVHEKVVIVKLNGDYLDTRIRNTSAELERYDPRMEQLVDRILDEFGLLVCGWSAKWDVALRSAVERAKNHRFTTYWAAKGPPNEESRQLIALRRAVVVQITDADSLFAELVEKVNALREFDRPHPLSTELAVASLKQYVADPTQRIRLRDLVHRETERVRSLLTVERFPVERVAVTTEEIGRRVRAYESSLETLTALLVNGCYFGEAEQARHWGTSIERLAVKEFGSGMDAWLSLRLYPALLLLYASGVACVAAGKYRTLKDILFNAHVREGSQKEPVLVALSVHTVFASLPPQAWPGQENKITPLPNHLFRVLREAFRDLIPNDQEYEEVFDRFEYIFSLARACHFKDYRHGFAGRFVWKRHRMAKDWVVTRIKEESQGDNWAPFKAGLFGDSFDGFTETRTAYEQWINDRGLGF